MKRVRKVLCFDGIWRREYILKAMIALGKPLPEKAVVHHVDENRLNNTNNNLVICEDRYYHQLLHSRMKAFKATGDPNMQTCNFCRQWDSLQNPDFRSYKRSGRLNGFYGIHRSCYNAWRRQNRVKGSVRAD